MKKNIFFLAFLSLITVASAQTGPGGVGSSSNNIIWLDASQFGLSNNDPVSTWLDFSGNANHLTQGTASEQPIFKTSQVNGLPAVSFDGVDDIMSFGSHITTSGITFFAVYNKPSDTKQAVFTLEKHILNHKNQQPYLLSTSPNKPHSVFKANSSFSVLTGRTSAGAPGERIQITNGTTETNTIRNSLLSRPSSVVGARVNASGVIDSYLLGDISELIIYNEDLSDAERNIVSEMLAAKYNLTSLNGIYSYTSTHPNDVKGIGMESNGGNTSAQGSDSLEISSASSLDNGDYLIVGHDGGTYLTSASVSGSIVERWERVWRADETGDVGTITVDFGLGVFGFSGEDNYVLLIENNDGDFSNGDVTVHTGGRNYNASTNTIRFTGVDLSDGDYFTLGEVSSGITSNGSGAWKTPSTWSCNCIPGEADVVTIGSPHVITIDSNASVSSLTVGSGSTLTFSGSDTLRVFDALDIQSFFNAGSGTVAAMKASESQNFNNASAINVELNNLYVNNTDGLNLSSGGWSILNSLQVSSGGLDVSAADSVVLVSDVSNTAQILESMSNAFTGDFIIQRHITSRNANYGNLSSPITDAKFTQLDDDLFLSGLTGGDDGNATVNGGGIFYSVNSFNPFADTTESIKNIDDDMSPTFGYEVYLASTLTTFNETTIDFVGTPNNGDITVPYLNQINKDWNLIGNPYQCHIDWDESRQGVPVSESYYVFNTDNGSYDFETGDSKRAIAPAQGFWVFNAIGGGLYVTFEESDKVSNTSSTFFRKKRQIKYPQFTLASEANNFKHSMHLDFEIFATNKIDEFDTPVLPSPILEAPELTSKATNSNKKLVMNSVNPLESSQIIPVSIYAGVDGEYKFSADNINVIQDNYNCIYLKDKISNEAIDLSVEPIYSFESKKGSSDRFELILSNDYHECQNILENKSFIQDLDQNLELRNSYDTWFLDYTLGEDISNFEIHVFNLNGQEVVAPSYFSASDAGSYSLQNLNSLDGIFLIQIRSNDLILNKTIKL